MKTRQYTITTGDYEDFRIVGRVEGPAKPALSTLYKQFTAVFIPDKPKSPKSHSTSWNIANSLAMFHAEQRLREAGYPDSVGTGFIEWLCRNHGFTQIAKDDFYVG